MIATGMTSLGCGMTVCIAIWAGESSANSVRIEESYKFGNWVVTVAPRSPLTDAVVAKNSDTGVQVLPASFTQVAPPPAPPLPDAETPPEPAVLPEATESAVGEASPMPVSVGGPMPCPVTSLELAERVRLYRVVYDSIPFSRAEYNANPSYRHDATMEFLFGQLRPTVVQRGTTKVEVNVPPIDVNPLIYNRYGVRRSYYPFYPSLGRFYVPR